MGGTSQPAWDRGPVLEQRGQGLRLPQQQAGGADSTWWPPGGEWEPGHEEGGDEPTAPEASSEFLRKADPRTRAKVGKSAWLRARRSPTAEP